MPRLRTLLLMLLALTAAAWGFEPPRVVHLEGSLDPPEVRAGESFSVRAVVRIDPGYHINSPDPGDGTLIPTEAEVQAPAGLTPGVPVFPPAERVKFPFTTEPIPVYQGKVAVTIPVQVDRGTPPGDYPLTLWLRYQACSDEICLAPTEETRELTLTVKAGEVRAAAPGVKAPSAPAAGDRDLFTGRSGLLLLAAFLLGGLALNLTPCVFPLVSITVAYFAQQAGRKGGTLGLAAVYVLGIAVTYSLLGVAAASTGKMLGELLANPAVLIGLAALMVVMAAASFGAFEIVIPSSLLTRLSESRAGVWGAFVMGLVVGLVAAPCVGPFLVGAIAFVARLGDPLQGFFYFFVLALGMGLPYLFLGASTGALERLPRSGDWLAWVKKLLGFVLLALAFYFVAPLVPDRVEGYGWAALLALAGVYLGLVDRSGRNLKGFRWVKGAVALALVVSAAWLLVRAPAEGIAFRPYTPAAFQRALERGRPVLVDVTAEWCIPCKELDARTFRDPEVVKASARFTAFKLDVSREVPPEARAFLRDYEVKGPPTVLFFDSEGRLAERLVGFEGPEEFLVRLRQVE